MLKKIKKINLSFKSISAILGSLIIIAGIAGGVYVGVWLMFIGGVVQIINAIKATTLVPIDIAIGIAKIMFCGLGSLIATVGIMIGSALIKR